MSTDFIARIIGMIVFAIGGTALGNQLGQLELVPQTLAEVIMGLVGALIGLVLTPFISTRPVRALREKAGMASTRSFVAGVTGFLFGLIIAALLASPLSMLPGFLGDIMPLAAVVICGYLGSVVFLSRQEDIARLIRPAPEAAPVAASPNGSVPDEKVHEHMILLDTSVIIDGRIEDIARTGFLPGTLLIPHFVLNELQYIADSSDALRRQRGRRGMEVLANLQKEPEVKVEIDDIDFEDVSAVDDKLVMLAKRTGYSILTNDYNLNRVADIQGVRILNINALANAVKVVFLPGEELSVEIIQEGKEHGQGVGYLEDGTMIVVENGSVFLGEEILTIVTKVLQTAAGRMIFARPADG